jgi:hypothetical protein
MFGAYLVFICLPIFENAPKISAVRPAAIHDAIDRH